jgi:hypothetical protein
MIMITTGIREMRCIDRERYEDANFLHKSGVSRDRYVVLENSECKSSGLHLNCLQGLKSIFCAE